MGDYNTLGRKRSTLQNAVSMILYQVLTILLGFIIPRLLLQTYGPELHGYTSTVTTIISYVELLSLGLSTTAIQALYQPLAEHDDAKLSQILNAVDRFYMRVGALYAGAVVLCAAALPLVIHAAIPTAQIVSLMLVTGATSTLECFVYSKHRVLLQADQRLFVVTTADLIALALRGALQIMLMLQDCSVVLVQGIPAVMVLLRMAMLARYVPRHYRGLDPKQPPDFSALSKRRSVFAHQVAGLVSNNTDVVILSVFGTMTQVSIFSVYNLIFSHLYTLITNVFSYGVLASFGQVIAEKNRDVLLHAYEKYEFTYYMFVTVVYSATAILILPFVGLYTQGVEGVVYEDRWLAVLFTAVGIATNLRIPCNTLITAAGHFGETAWRAILEAAINLTVSLALYPRLGVYGLLLGTLASFLYRTTDTIRYSHKYILRAPCGASLFRLIRVLALLALHLWLFQAVLPLQIETWHGWLIAAVTVTAAVTATTLLTNFLCERRLMREVCRYLFAFGRGRRRN